MCGIVGVATTEGWSASRRDVFAEALFADTFRGYDSTGIAVVPKDAVNTPAIVHKHVMTGPEFIQWPPVTKILKDFEKYKYVIGHNRAATQARVSKNNAHPFQVEHITLVHNGTITNSERELGVINSPAPVDSAYITAAFAIKGVKETLEKLTGGFALVWHDAKDGTINFARNASKPLSWCYEADKNTMFWASEGLMLWWLLDRNNMKVEGKFRNASPNVWYKFNPDDFREWERIPFEPHWSKPKTSQGSQAWVGGAPRMTHGGTSAPASSTPSETSGTKSSGNEEVIDEVDDPSFTVGVDPLFEQKGGAGRPGPKKLPGIKKRILDSGFLYEKLVRMSADFYVPYKNQDGRGVITGLEMSKKMHCEVHNVKRAFWEQLNSLDHRSIYGRIVNIKKGKGGKDILVVEVDGAKMLKFVFSDAGRRSLPQGDPLRSNKEPSVVDLTVVKEMIADREKEERRQNGASFRDDDPVHDGSDDDEDPTLYLGPFGRLIPESEFLARTSHGCGCCGGYVNPAFHQQMEWVGDGQSSPVCHECVKSGSYLEALGIRERRGF